MCVWCCGGPWPSRARWSSSSFASLRLAPPSSPDAGTIGLRAILANHFPNPCNSCQADLSYVDLEAVRASVARIRRPLEGPAEGPRPEKGGGRGWSWTGMERIGDGGRPGAAGAAGAGASETTSASSPAGLSATTPRPSPTTRPGRPKLVPPRRAAGRQPACPPLRPATPRPTHLRAPWAPLGLRSPTADADARRRPRVCGFKTRGADL